jgi:hypothetical protein
MNSIRHCSFIAEVRGLLVGLAGSADHVDVD